MRDFICTIGPQHLDPAPGSDVERQAAMICGAIGRILVIDLGKKVFRGKGGVQVENNEQRDRRLARTR